jgi:hypothetical protein
MQSRIMGVDSVVDPIKDNECNPTKDNGCRQRC